MMALLSGDGAINNRTDTLKAPGQMCGTHHSRQESGGGGLDKGVFFLYDANYKSIWNNLNFLYKHQFYNE